MSELHLFDASQYIYAGVQPLTVGTGVRSIGGVYRAMEMPCAGITNILNTYHRYHSKEGVDVLFCFDSIPTTKRELHARLFPGLGGYKGKRKPKDPAILVQQKMAVVICEQVGIPFAKVEGFEADDLIAAFVQSYQAAYDNVVIHSKDSDVFFLVSDNVTIEPVLRSGKFINRSNWENTVIKDHMIPYNLMTIHKMRDGEPGDNIPYVYAEPMDAIITGLPRHRYHEFGDNVILRGFIEDVVGTADSRTLGIFDLIAPLEVPKEHLGLYDDLPDERLLNAYSVACGCSGFRENCPILDGRVEETVTGFVDHYIELSR